MIGRWGTAVAAALVLGACSGSDATGTEGLAGPGATTAAVGTDPAAASTSQGTPATTVDAETSTTAEAATGPRNVCDVPEGEAAGPVTLTLWHYLGDRAEEELVASVAVYEADHPDVDVVVVPFEGTRAELDAWSAAGEADRPDLLLVSDDHIGSLAGSSGLLPFDDCLDVAGATLLPQIAATYTLDDRLLAAPYLASTPVLYYDATAFEEVGLDPARPPESLADLRSALETLVSSGVAPSGFAIETGAQSGGSWYVEQWLARVGVESISDGNGRSAGASTANWNAPEAVDGLSFLRGLVDDGLATVVDDSSGSADLLLMVSTDPAAMAVQTSASIGEVLDVLDQGGFGGVELGVGPLPGPGHGGLVGGAAIWAAAGHGADRQRAALDLVQHLTSPPVQAALASTTGYVPVRLESVDDPVLVDAYEARPQLRIGLEQVQAMPTEPANLVPVSPLRSTLREVLGAAVTAVLAQGIDPRQALDDAVAAANDLLAGA